MSETPVLLIIFNRPDETTRVLDSIRQYKPKRLYIASDSWRPSKLGEQEAVEQTRRNILQSIDWPCTISKVFQTKNLGCRRHVSNAINWFFESESEGIILEDDCIPDSSFFYYADSLLFKYRNVDKVMSISGHNFNIDKYYTLPKYSESLLSIYHHCWGWATWKNSWNLYDDNLNEWPQLRYTDWLYQIGGSQMFRNHWTNVFDKVYREQVDSWAYRWLYSCWRQKGLSALPKVSKITNIGFGSNATHTNKMIVTTNSAKKYKSLNSESSTENFFSSKQVSLKEIQTKEDQIIDQAISKNWFKINFQNNLKRKAQTVLNGFYFRKNIDK